MRGTSSMGLPARSTPGGIHSIPLRGAPGGTAIGALTIPAASASSSLAPRLQHAASSAVAATAATSAQSISVGLLTRPLAQPELLHLQLKSLARNLEQTRRVGDIAVRLMKGATHQLLFEA